MTERFLPSQCNWELLLTFVPNDFICMSKDSKEFPVKLLIDKLELEFNRVQLTKEAMMKVSMQLTRNEMLSLPFLNYSIQSFQVNDHSQIFNSPPATINGSPRRIYLFMVKESAVFGDQHWNPMAWKNFNIEYLKVNMAGADYTLEDMNFKHEGEFFLLFIFYEINLLAASGAFFQTVCKGLGVTNRDFAFNYDDFLNCYTVFCFDTTTTRSSAGCQVKLKNKIYAQQDEFFLQEINTHNNKTSTYYVTIRFAKILHIGEPARLFVVSEIESVLQIDPSFNVSIVT